jgi:glycosyltransferase involved in cell wall biosynthesis
MRRLSIALVLPGGVDRGGERRVIPVVLALLARLAARHDVRVFATNQEPVVGRWMLRGAEVRNLAARRGLHRVIGALCAAHRERPFDVVHALWTGLGGAAAAAAARLVGVPLLVHLTGGELVSLPEVGYGQMQRWRGRLLNRCILRGAAAITATSLPIVQLAAAAGFAAVRVPLGIDLLDWPVRAPATRRAVGPARLVQVATLNRVKDHATTLDALRILKSRRVDFQMDFVGEDTLGGALQARAEALGLDDHVRFHGFLTQSQLRPLLDGAHLHVVSSRHEAGPAVALEAAIAGVPTVGTRVGHLAEWDFEATSAVPPGDGFALAQALLSLLDDEPRRLRAARAMQAVALAEDADFTARRFEQLYGDLIRS